MSHTFRVGDTFEIAGRGLVIVGKGSFADVPVATPLKVEVTRLDGSALTAIAYKEWLVRRRLVAGEFGAFLVVGLGKRDVPLGSTFTILGRGVSATL